MALELYKDDAHLCLLFQNLCTGEAIQANQVIILDHGCGALLDPGGEMLYQPLQQAISSYMALENLEYVLASHQDPDIISSLDKWLTQTSSKIVIPSVWERFIPHLTLSGRLTDRVISIPDQGLNLPFGETYLQALPAHFLHAEGNFSFYDKVSQILFSGDIGANFPRGSLHKTVTEFKDILPWMEPFHRRYMGSNKACRFWVEMVRKLDVDKIVPQHGRYLEDPRTVEAFLNWFEELECGTDLVDRKLYSLPRMNA